MQNDDFVRTLYKETIALLPNTIDSALNKHIDKFSLSNFSERDSHSKRISCNPDFDDLEHLFCLMDLVFGGIFHYDFFDKSLRFGDKSN